MIEFEYLTTPGQSEQRALIVVNTEQIGSFEPLASTEERCLVVNSGRQLVVSLGYPAFRALVIEARSGFAAGQAS